MASPFLFMLLLIMFARLPLYSQVTFEADSLEFRIRASHIAFAAGVAGGTALLVTQDLAIHDFFARNRTELTDVTSDYFFSPLGNGLISLPVLGILYGTGWLKEDEKAKSTAFKGLQAYLLAGILTGIIKQATHRHRPFQDDPPDPMQWDGPFSHIEYNSFPSGHSSSIFAVATVLATEYKDRVWIPVLCYSIAGITAIYRVGVERHWASDVLFGSALGFATGKFISFYNPLGRLKVLPFSSTGAGITVTYLIN